MTNEQEKAVDEFARKLIEREVCYCVSGLVSSLQKISNDVLSARSQELGFDEDDMLALAYRDPTADDYRDAAPDGFTVSQGEDGQWIWLDASEADCFDEDSPEVARHESELDAWRDLFDSRADMIDRPDGAEVYEHWLVTDYFAAKLEAKGERIVRDVAGLTIWGRSTTGQAIYADGVIQEIAAELLA
ncbi:MAG: hypothetical protein V4696_03885 [Pseudomonadota bacterium]